MTTVGTQPAVALPATALPHSVLRVADLSDDVLAVVLDPAADDRRLDGSYVVDVPAALTHIRTCVREAIEQAGGEVVLTEWPAMWTDRATPLGERLQPPLRAAVISVPDHARLEDFRRHGRVPIVNAGSDSHHPLKVLADLLTVRELLGRASGVSIAYVGPAGGYRTSLIEAAARLGIDLRVVTSDPDVALSAELEAARAATGARSAIVDPMREVVSVDVVIGDDLPFGLVATRVHLPVAMTGAAAGSGASTVEGPQTLLFHRQENLQRVTRRLLALVGQAGASS